MAEEMGKCPECGSAYIVSDSDSGEVVCGRCGLVISEKAIREGPEWRSFSPEEGAEKCRVGAPSTLLIHDKGLTTVLDSRASKLKPEAKFRMKRMEKLQLKMRAPSVADRNLGKAMTEIDRISGGLGLPKSVKETAALIYRKASKIKIIRGRSISLIAAASIYAACRQVNLPKTLKMVENASGIGKGEIARAYRLLVRMLDLKMPVATPAQFIPKIVESLEIPWVVQVVALKVLREVRETFISAGNDPRTLAAAAIYMASRITGFRVRQSDVAAAAGITEISIRNCCRRLSTLAAAMIEKQELSIRSRPSL